jgi:hypothetical protein
MVTYHATRATFNGETWVLAEPFVHHWGLTLAEVAALVQLSEDEIAWAIEENGQAETDEWVVEEDE